MVGMKEWKKQNGDTTVSVKKRNNDPGFSRNPCGGCNACHQMTGIHPVTDNPIFGGSGDGSGGHWPNLQRPCATNFFQRNLGNNAMQAIAVSRQTSGQATSGGGTAVIQRKCACGGSCASCAGKEEELGKIQTKLTIGPANDVYEQEADRVAEQIMRMPDSFVQYEDNQSNVGINIQRIPAGGDSVNTDSDIQLNLNDGQPLSPSTRQFMEPRFGIDFDHVRLHADQDAHRTASQIKARAFTYGHHIWFGEGENEQNKNLMAHELSHVVQQGGGSPGRGVCNAVQTSKNLIQRQPPISPKPESENVWGLIVTRPMCGCRQGIRDGIAWANTAAGTYAACDVPANATSTDVEACFDLAHPTAVVVATTTSSGTVTLPPPSADPCERIKYKSAFVHEEMHRRHTNDIARGQGRAFFKEWRRLAGDPNRLDTLRASFPLKVAAYETKWNDGHDWAQDEVNSYTWERRFLRDTLSALNRIC